MEKKFEEAARKAPSEIDGRALMWTYESLDEDHELEQFFAGIPGFCSSKVVDNPQSSLDGLRSWTVVSALKEFSERTWSSNLVSETIKIRRLAICVRAIDAAYLSNAAYEILRPALFGSVELGHCLINWGNNDDRETTLLAQGIIACIVANVPQRNERWFSLTMHHLGISEHVLRLYLDHGDSVLLANLIHFTRQIVRNFLKANWEVLPVLHILQGLRWNYNVQDTLPGLQHDFCSLWNEIVLRRRDRDHDLLLNIHKDILPIYVTLHQGSILFWADEFQLCSIPSHLTAAESSMNEVDGGRTPEIAPAPIITSPALHHRDTVPFVIPPATQYHAPPLPTSNLDHAIPHLVDEQSLIAVPDYITPVASSFHLTPLEIGRIPDGTAADLIQGTTDLTAISSMVDTDSCSTSCRGTVSRPTRNVTTATPSSSIVPDTVPPPIPLLTVSPDPAAPHISADPAVNQSGRPPDDGSISHPSSQTFTPFTLAPQVISSFDSNAATEIRPLDAPDNTLDPNLGVMSRSFTPPSDVVGYSL